MAFWNKKKDEKPEEENDPTGVKGYIDGIILNPNLEKDLKSIGSPYQIPITPVPDEKNGKKEKKK